MEIVSGPGDEAPSSSARPRRSTSSLVARLRVRQRPGPGNALGLVKFVFPNDENVYMHGTPAPQLFERSRRDFSHGCVRVQDPVALAEWVLKDRPEWTRDRILAAMHGSHIDSRQPAAADPRDPVLHHGGRHARGRSGPLRRRHLRSRRATGQSAGRKGATVTLPFTRGEFLDVFAAYNDVVWAGHASCCGWQLSRWSSFLRKPRSRTRRLIAGLLAVHWIWAGWRIRR